MGGERLGLSGMRMYADAHGLCGEYGALWDGASDARSLFDLAMDVNGVRFLCDSYAGGWGLDVGYIQRRFGAYINGAYISGHVTGKGRGYTSELWCGVSDGRVVDCRCTLTLLLSCRVTFVVRAGMIRCLYVSCGSDVDLLCDGRADVYVGRGSRVVVRGDGDCRLHDGMTDFGSGIH